MTFRREGNDPACRDPSQIASGFVGAVQWILALVFASFVLRIYGRGEDRDFFYVGRTEDFLS